MSEAGAGEHNKLVEEAGQEKELSELSASPEELARRILDLEKRVERLERLVDEIYVLLRTLVS